MTNRMGEGYGALPPTVPIRSTCVYSHEQLRRAIVSSVKRGLPVLEQQGASDKRLIVIGGGPSLNEGDFSQGDIACINGTLAWLLDRGIVPKYWFGVDPQPQMVDFVRPHPDITYCVASCCHGDLFDALDGLNVRLWHSDNNANEASVLPKGSRLVRGGTTMATRAIPLGYFLGYRDFEFHGVDSSYEKANTHAYVPNHPTGRRLIVESDGQLFVTSTDFLKQAQAMLKIIARTKDQVRVSVKGRGLLPAMIRSGTVID